jgi:hypothetical protein
MPSSRYILNLLCPSLAARTLAAMRLALARVPGCPFYLIQTTMQVPARLSAVHASGFERGR